MKNICIYTIGRSGSNYLNSFIRRSDYILINEPFTLFSRWNAAEFLMGLGLLYKKNKIDLFQIQDLLSLVITIQSSKPPYSKKLLDAKLLKMWFDAVQTEKSSNILWKFMGWYSNLFGLDICDMFDTIDYLILNYRKNILKQWISFIKAQTTGEWITEKQSKNTDVLIVWDKIKYFEYFNYVENNYLLMKKNFEIYNKPKTVVCYEDLSEINDGPNKYLQNLFQKSNIELPINENSVLKRQSDSNKPIENNFSNKQEFLDDYDDIKDRILTSIVFD